MAAGRPPFCVRPSLVGARTFKTTVAGPWQGAPPLNWRVRMESRSKLYNALGAILAVSLIGCLETEESGRVVADNSPHEPLFVATFDHEPSEEEVAERLAQFGQQHDGKLNVQPPTGSTPPIAGQKLIRLDVWTSDISAAGTNDANRVTFVGFQPDARRRAVEHLQGIAADTVRHPQIRVRSAGFSLP